MINFFVFVAFPELETTAAFSYSGDTGPDKWGSLSPDYKACSNGKSQSPINIVEDKAVPNKTLKPLRRQYYPVNATLVNNGYNVEMEFGNAGVLIGNGKNYTLQQMHWHTRSEHTIDNASFDAELHLVHKASDDSISVVAILYELGKPDPILTKIKSKLDKLASNGTTEIDIGTFNTSQLWKNTHKYYRYVGSLTTPPCTENVIWHVLGEERSISQAQIDALKAPLLPANKNNYRPVQPLNGRKVALYDDQQFTEVLMKTIVLEKIDEQEGFKLFGTTDSREPENVVEILEQREQKVLFHESTELGRASNLRKSLDWDTAFFISAGFLDPEKLFIINKGFEKVEAHLLPVTQEDLCTRRYADSESTLDSDDFSLDSNQSTEVDLFEEIRASIEKSNIMSNTCKSVCKLGVGEAHKRETHSLKKLDDISRNRDAKKNMVSVGQRKKISLGADHVKMGNKVATLGFGKDFILSKKSGLGNSCSTSTTTSLESSSSVSVTTSSASSLKSSSNSRRKADSRKSSLATSGSTSKTPLTCSLGDKIVLENPSLSTPSLSMSNHSSYESPASSIEGCSNYLEVSFHTNTSRGACLGNDSTQALNFQSFPHDECFDDQESHQTRFPNLCLEVVRGTANDLAKSTRNFKPSGLRMPSPRIGFFDEDKAMMSTVGRDFLFHFGAQSALPNIIGVTNRKRYATQNQELDKNSPKMSSTSATSRNLPGKTSKGQTDTSPQLCRENCSRSSKVIDGGHNSKKLGLHYSLKAERKRTEGILKYEMGRESKRPMTKEHERASRRPLENDPHSLHDNEKENIPSFGDHVNGLNRCLEVIDLNRGVVIELEGKRGCSHSHLGDNFAENDKAPIYSSSFSKEYLFPRQQVSPNMLSKTGPLSLPTTVEFMPSTRTPLADKNSAPMCGAKQSGQLGSSSQALDGILGFGLANSSMISQLASVGKVKKMFAHCLDGTNGGGIFAIGQLVMMFYNFPQMYWISQSGKAVVIYSGTTLAYLADDMFTPLMEKIMAAQPDLKLHTVEQQLTCFQFNGNHIAMFGLLSNRLIWSDLEDVKRDPAVLLFGLKILSLI
ncbi:hypothetical protein LOK49_LG05G00981 [Camellia lanceoleosa]|uniref:Uncharacterized protein n=1 Tax=Camellia lanceoleosa TaxID=1840588 RepID=A0ACC0HLR1_9ERIC|nr:hypothetical protein LOK49_LG05G00981 [Camellia lanceoleosa]